MGATLRERQEMILRQVSLGTFVAVGAAMVKGLLYLHPLGMRQIIYWGSSFSCTPVTHILRYFLWMGLPIGTTAYPHLIGIVPLVGPYLFAYWLWIQCIFRAALLTNCFRMRHAVTAVSLLDILTVLLGPCSRSRIISCAMFDMVKAFLRKDCVAVFYIVSTLAYFEYVCMGLAICCGVRSCFCSVLAPIRRSIGFALIHSLWHSNIRSLHKSSVGRQHRSQYGNWRIGPSPYLCQAGLYHMPSPNNMFAAAGA